MSLSKNRKPMPLFIAVGLTAVTTPFLSFCQCPTSRAPDTHEAAARMATDQEFEACGKQSVKILSRIDSTGKLDLEAWRFALHMLDSDRDIELFGFAILLEGVKLQPQFRLPSLAIVESGAIRANASHKARWLEYYRLLMGVKGGVNAAGIGKETSDEDYVRSGREQVEHLARMRIARKVDASAADFVDRALTHDSVRMRLRALGVIALAVELGGESRKWALQIVERQLQKAARDEKPFWMVVREVLSGRYESALGS